MTTLALEFSSDQRSVAIVRDGAVLAEQVFEGSVRTPIFALIDGALSAAGVERERIEWLVIGIGPGSYTGVRLAISVAQGWQLGSPVSVAGVNSLANLARVAGGPPALLAIDAQRGECAVAACEQGRLLEEPRLVSIDTLKALLRDGKRILGPDVPRLLGGGEALFPKASVAAQLAAESGGFVPAETLAPVYLRAAAFLKAPPSRNLEALLPSISTPSSA